VMELWNSIISGNYVISGIMEFHNFGKMGGLILSSAYFLYFCVLNYYISLKPEI
jgi:hypothetical protein